MLDPIIITVAVTVAIAAFMLGFILAHKRFAKRVGELKMVKQQFSEWQSKLKVVQDKVWSINQSVENYKQEAEKSIAEFKKKKAQATEAIAKMNADISDCEQALKKIDNETKDLQAMQSERKTIEAEYEKLGEKKHELQATKKVHADLKSELSLYTDMDSFVEYGFYPLPAYGEASSGAYNEKLKNIRQQQKNLLKDGAAYTSPSDIEITGNAAHDKKLMKSQGNLLITAFNSECDYLISRVSSKNYEATLTKIEKLAEQLEKRLISLEIGIDLHYVELKMQECAAYYQYICQKQAEAEEQREIRAQIREEAAAQREIEKALKEAKKEEQMLQQAMEKARHELAVASEEQKQQYEAKLQALTEKLTEAEARGERALSMAQQTKKGHVYVISNIGSFGENVFKIGMTRRLEPLDRVKELGDASVPFPFDVHAMIFSEDAPGLEKKLHRHFEEASVNKVNNRKEFFEVSLKEVREYIEKQNLEAHWTMTADATEYRQSLVISEQIALNVA